MKQNLSFLTALTMVIVLLAAPLSLSSAIALETTTTSPYTTTTTTWVWDCISTTPPMTTTTTSTTLNLTGPDGINPDYTTIPSTTTTVDDDLPPTTHPVTIDLLSSADFYENGNISILANPNYGGEWMSADCYTYDGASVSIVAGNGGPWDITVLRYLHVTVTANVPFMIKATDTTTDIFSSSGEWIARALGTELVDGWIPKGEYVGVVDLYEEYSALIAESANLVDLVAFEVYLSKPGSITVGHIALSPDAICTKTAPKIQTTTIPKFPTTGTTDATTLPTDTTTSTTTTTTVITYTTTGGVPVTSASTGPHTTIPITSTTPSGGTTTTLPIEELYTKYDVNADGYLNMFDCLFVYQATSGADREAVDPALCDFNGDGTFNMLDCLVLLNLVDGTA